MVLSPPHPGCVAQPRRLLLGAPASSPASARAAQLAAHWQAAVKFTPASNADTLAVAIARTEADLVVADGLDDAVERFVCASPKPLLAVKTASVGPYRKLLVAIDHSERGARALDWLGAFPDADVELLHAYHLPLRDVIGADPTLPMGSAPVDALPPLSVRGFRVDNRLGMPEQLLLGAVEAGGHDLAIVATHGAHDLGVSLIGRTAAALLAGLRCDVLMVPTADRD